MNVRYDKLLDDICIRLGFCGSFVDGQALRACHFLPASRTLTADDFADASFRAEGWAPDGSEAQTFRSRVRDAFVQHMGELQVDAAWTL